MDRPNRPPTADYIVPVTNQSKATAIEDDDNHIKSSNSVTMSDADPVPSSLSNAASVPVAPAGSASQEDHDRAKNQSAQINHPPSQLPSQETQERESHLDDDEDDRNNDGDDDEDRDHVSMKADSEAETIIQSSRESLSPEKRRKVVTHERKRSNDVRHPISPFAEDKKRKRNEIDGEQEMRRTSPRPRAMSMSSVVKPGRDNEKANTGRRRESIHSRSIARKSDEVRPSRGRSSSDSAVEGDSIDSRHRPQESRNRDRRPTVSESNINGNSKDHSVSPTPRSHKRAGSATHQGSKDELKKKRAPAPLLTNRKRHSSEDRLSISSSASGSPLPSAQLRRLTSEGTLPSPAKPLTHKKQRDQNGRTRLARACAAQEYEAAVARYHERPEDLNVADNAGNTPLQIASLEGCIPIVKFLLDTNCEVDTKNIDRDTPLIDAVENGHLEVVKLLLAAGANPRVVNAEGDEPYDLVPSDSEDYEEIRRILALAKNSTNRKPRSEEPSSRVNASKDIATGGTSAASPRESPPAPGNRSPPPASGRRRTVRSEVTRNDLLWTKATPENLREFAAKGDMAGVANILNVGQKADAESLIAAAKGGHEDVMQLLLGIGFAEPDPNPIKNGSLRPGFNTPMLAAIGRGSLAVIRLLLDQPRFNPIRRPFKDLTYYELSAERRGENWETEFKILKKAYDDYIQTKKHRNGGDTKSPRRIREKEKEAKRPLRRESTSPAPSFQKRSMRSPTSSRPKEHISKQASLTREKTRDSASATGKDRSGAGTYSRTKNGNRDDNQSEHSVAISEPDSIRQEKSKARVLSSQRRQSESLGGDEVFKRRRLIAGRPPQDHVKRRPSLVSSESRSDPEEILNPRLVHRKGDSSTNTHENPSLKRSRNSVSPCRSRSRGSESRRDSQGMQIKKRRVLPDFHSRKLVNGSIKKRQNPDLLKPSSQSDAKSPETYNDKPESTESSEEKAMQTPTMASEDIVVKKEQKRTDTRGLNDIPMNDESEQKAKQNVESKATAVHKRKDEEGKKAALKTEEKEETTITSEKYPDKVAEMSHIAKEEEARGAAEKAARLAQEKAEEEERRRKEAEQRRIKQAEEERQRRAEQERQRIAKLIREQEEQEQRRRNALPDRLREAANLVGSNDPRARSHEWLKNFMPVATAKTGQIDAQCDPDIALDQWVPNYLVAPLLATNDLQLSQYSSWEKRKATATQRQNLWRVTRRMLVQTNDSNFRHSSLGQVMQRECETRPKYFDMEHVFWVKVSYSTPCKLSFLFNMSDVNDRDSFLTLWILFLTFLIYMG